MYLKQKHKSTLRMRSTFVRNVAVLVSGRAGAMLITFLLTPVIARLYAPADFGVVAVLVTVTQLIGGVSMLNYHRAAVIPGSIEESGRLLVLARRMLAVVLIILIVIWVVAIVTGIGMPFGKILGIWVWIVPLAVALVGLAEVRVMALTCSKEFGVISRADIGQALARSGGRIGLGVFFGSSVWALVAGYLAGLLVQLAILKGHTERYKSVTSVMTGWRDLMPVAREYKDFPLMNMPSNILSNVSAKLPVLVLGMWLGPAVVGFFAMADRLVRAPINTVVIALNRVYLQKVAEMQKEGRGIGRALRKTTMTLFALGIIPFGILWLFGEEILIVVLGEAWREAGYYVEILAPWFFAAWTSAVIAPTMIVQRKQGLWLVLQLTIFLFRIGVFGWCFLAKASVEYTLTLFVAVNVILIMLVMIVGFVSTSHGVRSVRV